MTLVIVGRTIMTHASLFQKLGGKKNEVELARKVEIEKADILAAGELGQIMF